MIGLGTLNVEGMLKLTNVLHIEEVKANSISIHQLCDEDLIVIKENVILSRKMKNALK